MNCTDDALHQLRVEVTDAIVPRIPWVRGVIEREAVHDVCQEIVRRLLAGGISETAIRNTVVHYKEPGPIVACDGIDQPMTMDGEPVTAHQLMHHRKPSS